MANYILKNNVDILRCANWAMDLIFGNLKLAINEEGLEDNSVLNDFLEKLDQDNYGRGCVYVEILDYFSQEPNEKKLSLTLLYTLMKKTIEKIKQDISLDPRFIQRLEEFKEKILI